MALNTENINFSNLADPANEEAQIEQLLSEKLMAGFVLMEKACPVCATPLVKNGSDEDEETPVPKDVNPVMVPSGSFDQPFKPVKFVPFCVSCSSHVITQECEISILEKCDSLKAKGGILVAISEGGSTAEATENDDVKDVEIIDVTQMEDPAAKQKELFEYSPESMVEYSVRRKIATKVLGAKMLQGYSLLEKQCDKCGMPRMSHGGEMVDCVVCPVLARKAKKQLKAQKQLEEETNRLERGINAAKGMPDNKAVLAAEQARIDAAVGNQEAVLELEERKLNMLKQQADLAQMEEARKARSAKIEAEYAAITEKRNIEALKIAEENKRLERMEHRRKMGIASALENMNRDVLVAEHRKRLEDKAKLDEQIKRLEEDRVVEKIESKKLADEHRAEQEALMLATLEEDAKEKARAAEEAIRKAKAALEHVHSARREVIAQTIAQAEEEAIAEAESVLKSQREDYKEQVILPSDSDIKRENWETLRIEGRSVMTRRVMAGWVLLADFCVGTECHNSPLITKDGKIECVVCGGCGNGMDGAYAPEDYDVTPTDAELEEMRTTGMMPTDADFEEMRSGFKVTAHPIVDVNADFETKRDLVSKEIGKRMVEGWTLLDSSCPKCVMPLMMDPQGNTDICVLHGPVGEMKDDKNAFDLPLSKDNVRETIRASAAVKTDASTIQTNADNSDEFTLTESIKLNTHRQASLVSNRGDPPAVHKAAVRNAPAASVHEEKKSDGVYGTDDVTVKSISEMILQNPAYLSGKDLTSDEISELVDIFVATNFSETVSDEVKKDVARELRKKTRERNAIIMEDRPINNYDMYYEMKEQPNPESRQGFPPRITSPRGRKNGDVMIVGGPADFDNKSYGDLSRTSRVSSVATDALDTILDRIERAKAQLLKDDLPVSEQLAAANLIEKLAQAAVAMKKLENIDD